MYNIDKIKEKEILKKKFFIILAVALSSQIYLDLYIANFSISFAIILFSVFMYSFEELNSIIMGAYISIAVYILRVLVHYIRGQNIIKGIHYYFPEIFFYFSYAVFFYFILKKISRKNINSIFLYLIFSDYLANFIEILIRDYKNIYFFYNIKVKEAILIVALIRSFLIWISLISIKYYKMMIFKEEHEIRYRKLLIMISRLKTETYWMKKTMGSLENVMADAYKLFENINLNNKKESWAEDAVNIAKNVHEIKKEYGIVVRGVEEITDIKGEGTGMYFKDLINILSVGIKNEIKYKNLNIITSFRFEDNFYTEKHYYLMSILRNLIMNSVEAMNKKQGFIYFNQKSIKENYVFVVEDNGSGIKNEDIKYIFSPGYSTKINYETGEINRGLGLSIVKTIVEEQLKGKIDINSKINEGTEFIITVPKIVLNS